MANIYITSSEAIGRKPYFSILGIQELPSDESGKMSLLWLEVQEYNVIAGDIAVDDSDKLTALIEKWRQDHQVIEITPEDFIKLKESLK